MSLARHFGGREAREVRLLPSVFFIRLAASDASQIVRCHAVIHGGGNAGVVLEESGVTWQNRGGSFSHDPQALNGVQDIVGKFSRIHFLSQ